jgi:hypothetical protein
METFTDRHGDQARPDGWTIEQAQKIAEYIKTDQYIAQFDPALSYGHAFGIELINRADLSSTPIYIYIRPINQGAKKSFDASLSFRDYLDHTGSRKSFYCSNYQPFKSSSEKQQVTCIGISREKSPEIVARDIVRRLLPAVSYFLPKYQECLKYSEEIKQRLETLYKLLTSKGVKLRKNASGGFYIEKISGGMAIRDTGELAISHYYLNKPEQIAELLSLLLSFEE